MSALLAQIGGAGLGLRRPLMQDLARLKPGDPIDFFEIAPENWLHLGGRLGQKLRPFSEAYPIICHGLSLSIGGIGPLNRQLLLDIKNFIATHNIRHYSEHLSYTGDEAQLYELFPLPLTWEAVQHTAARIRMAQDILGERIAIENATYYTLPAQDMSEVEFINAVVAEADCQLLLDVNNLYVNSQNHHYCPQQFLQQLNGEAISYLHIAGHWLEEDHWRIDTHAERVDEPVWALLADVYARFGVKPTLLERDDNFPAISELTAEVGRIKQAQRGCGTEPLQTPGAGGQPHE
ncbi:MAG TPA: DUF692 domain-containing protein [Cellvibrionaceae bacterium]|nr:DUF692 domain-containing protein [Cellvibrionaceae bacterium]